MLYTHQYLSRNLIVQDVEKAVNGEYTAISCYEQLARMAPNESARNQIIEIRNDEIRHFHMFSRIYAQLTGRQPVPQMVEQCPSEYMAGLRFAFLDEQKTVDFYLEIADKTNDMYIREQFRRASADEQNHAVWFLYLMSN